MSSTWLPPPGDFLCISLVSGFMQLRYNLGDGTVVLQSQDRVNLSGQTWHTVKAGRVGHNGFLRLDDKEVQHEAPEGRMSTLDVRTDVFVGGLSSLSSVSRDATEKEAVGFTGGIRELLLNGQRFVLTEKGALDGADVRDWDGTACGYNVCHNGGRCWPASGNSFTCECPPSWAGPRCDRSVPCLDNLCSLGSVCSPDGPFYRCMCPLGRQGTYCDQEASLETLRFIGNSYLKYSDAKFSTRNLKHTQVSFNFSTTVADGLILWLGEAGHEGHDYLAVGLEHGRLKTAVNLGDRLSVPVTSNVSLCCEQWQLVSISLNRTLLQVFLNQHRILSKDLDPFERYVALDYGGRFYFGGFELNRNLSVVTSGLFSQGFVGSLKNITLYQDSEQLLFVQNSEGFNVHQGSE